MLRKLQMRLFQKIGLGIIFCVAFVTIAMDILRTYKSYGGGAFSDSFLYSILEADLAVTVACIPTYRAFFGMKRKIPRDGAYLDIGLAPTTRMGDGTLHSTATNREATYSLEELPTTSEPNEDAGYLGRSRSGLKGDTEVLTQGSYLNAASRNMRRPAAAHLA
ncbi:MAG: hypothetical protein M1821_004479 [Bathelium mastoideum]|nr:MAG: hypothetical protein M1821_004479 [Bathelium mastoideum]